MNLNVELIAGDVNQVRPLDFLLMGHKNPLREQICKETQAAFELVYHQGMLSSHLYELLEAPSYRWRRIAAVKFRSNNKLSETQFSRISAPLVTVLENYDDVKSVGILPPSWRNPQYCALGVVYSLWLLGYAEQTSKSVEFSSTPSSIGYRVISNSGIYDFEKVLEDDCKLMWDFIRKLCKAHREDILMPSYRQLRKVPIHFIVTKRQL